MTMAAAACAGTPSGAHPAGSSTASPVASPTRTTLTLKPLLVIKPGSSYFPNFKKIGGIHCKGVGGFADLRKGAGVTIYDGSGHVAGSGFIRRTVMLGKKCVMQAVVPGVTPAGFYKVQFVNRNKVAFSAEQLEKSTAVETIG